MTFARDIALDQTGWDIPLSFLPKLSKVTNLFSRWLGPRLGPRLRPRGGIYCTKGDALLQEVLGEESVISHTGFTYCPEYVPGSRLVPPRFKIKP